jgi:deoxyadenosine/deoxycytidine kinase
MALINTPTEGTYYIAIAGNIGVGKTTLTNMLCEKLGWQPVFEAFNENPFLADFYEDMPRWGFHSQVFFLSQRLKQHHFLLRRNGSIVQDRSIYEDAEVFAKSLYLQGTLAENEWQTYFDLYKTIARVIAPPNLVVFLQASIPTLLKRIALRGRDYELSISREYLERLNERYEDWIANFKVCPTLTIETDALDYVQYEEHLDLILQKINERLHGKDILSL